jgi:membrane-associated phospholipid phosphatase
MGVRNEPFLAWPGWPILTYAAILGLAVTAWWTLIYCGADWLTGLRPDRVRVHFDAELAMPFAPASILIYVSLEVVFLAAPFVLRTRRELNALAACLFVVTAIAGVGFVLIPAELGYPPVDPGEWSTLFAVVRRLALRHNLVPSLHVAMGCACLAAYGTRCGVLGKSLLTAWAIAIMASTLLTHQHHLLDVATGLILAWAGKRSVYDRWARQLPTARTPRASPAAGPGSPV